MGKLVAAVDTASFCKDGSQIRMYENVILQRAPLPLRDPLEFRGKCGGKVMTISKMVTRDFWKLLCVWPGAAPSYKFGRWTPPRSVFGTVESRTIALDRGTHKWNNQHGDTTVEVTLEASTREAYEAQNPQLKSQRMLQ